MDDLIILSRFVQFAALALLFGGSLFRLCVQPRQPDQRQQWPWAIDIAAAVAALLSAVGWFVGVAATMGGGWAEVLVSETVTAVLIDTRFGRLWIGRLALAAAILGLVVVSRGRTRRWDVAMLLLSAGLTASLAGVGHGSVGAGMLGRVHLAGDVVHLLCATAWLGGLVGLGLILHRAGKGNDTASLELVRAVVRRFSRLGYWMVGLLLVTGCLNTIVLVASPESLFTTAYGRVLLVKIGLVAVMIAIAIRNRFILAPRIVIAPASDGTTEKVIAALYYSVAQEQGVGLIVLATVAVLGTIHPLP
jgi:copper resistance protein D